MIGTESRASSAAADTSELRQCCLRRLERRYGGGDGRGQIPDGALASLEKELAFFEEQGLIPPLLRLGQLWKPVADRAAPWAVQGAAASSIVLFGIGMLPFCPADHGLLFDRFGVAVRDGLLEITAVASPDVLERLSHTPSPGNSGNGKGIRLEIHALPDLQGRRHWEPLDSSLSPPTPTQVRSIVETLGTGGDDPFFGPRDSPGRALIQTVQPSTFEDLVLCQQLDTPPLIEAGWPRRFTDGGGEVKPPHPGRDQPLLPHTRGLPMYQEDLMGVLATAAGYGGADAYRFLKVLSRDRPGETALAKEDFLERAVRNGFTRSHAECLLAVIEEGARLGVCKANAISMGYLAAGLVLGQ